jgi:O-acetylhomoserine (thiol)-lyase
MLSVDLAGGRSAGAAFIDALAIAERTASLGSIHTIVVHPPSTTHRQLSEAGLLVSGIGPGTLRVSIGLEDEADLREDFARALAVARSAVATPEPIAAPGA